VLLLSFKYAVGAAVSIENRNKFGARFEEIVAKLMQIFSSSRVTFRFSKNV
jgi:hypothetical protein